MRTLLAISTALVMSGQFASVSYAGDVNLVEIDKRVQKLMQRPEMTGLAVAIVEDGEIVFSKGYGQKERGKSDRVTADTVFRWASLSKAVAATAVMQLAEQGELELQKPIKDYAPSIALPEARFEATLEDVLSQRTGIAHNAYDRRIEDGQPAKKVRGALHDVDRLCEPGMCHSYQNVAYDGASEAIESVTGVPYKAVVADSIFRPLGMTTASTTLSGLTQSKDWAKPHNSRGHPISKVKPTYYRLPAAAGVNSSITDLGKWMQAQFSEDSPLTDYVLHSTQTPRISTPHEDRKMRRFYGSLKNARYSLGWRVYDLEGNTVIGHRGAVSGYRAAILFDPTERTGVAVLWNSSHYRPSGLALEVFDQVYDKPKRDWMRLGPKYNRYARGPAGSGSGSR